jgi:hypothetical protein
MKVKINWMTHMYNALSALCIISATLLLINRGSHAIYIFILLFALGIFFGYIGVRRNSEKRVEK